MSGRQRLSVIVTGVETEGGVASGQGLPVPSLEAGGAVGREGALAACDMWQDVSVGPTHRLAPRPAGETYGARNPNCARPGLPTGSISMSNCENLIKVLSQFENRRET